jgi:hypothetical protein
LDDKLLLRHIFGQSEHRPFFSISAVFEVLGKGFSNFFLNAYKYSIQTLNSVTLEKKEINTLCYVLNDNSKISKGRGLLVVTYKWAMWVQLLP